MLEPVNREDDSVYPPVSHPTIVSLLASAMHAASAFVVPQRSVELGTLRIVLDLLGFDQARTALVEGLRLIDPSPCR
jgi:hypothetical protein